MNWKQGSSNLIRLMVVVANYTSKSSFTNCLPHLKEEKVFGSTKRFTNFLPSVNNDSHRLDRVNFFHPKVFVLTTKPNIVEDVCMHKPPFSSNNLLPLVFQGGLELKENICVDGQWCIEHYPPNFTIQCFTF